MSEETNEKSRGYEIGATVEDDIAEVEKIQERKMNQKTYLAKIEQDKIVPENEITGVEQKLRDLLKKAE